MLRGTRNNGFLIKDSSEKLRRCRVCLKQTTDKENDFIDILEKYICDVGASLFRTSYLDLLNFCTKLNISELEISSLGCNFLCGSCKDDLTFAYKFINKAILGNDFINDRLGLTTKQKPMISTTTTFELENFRTASTLENDLNPFTYEIDGSSLNTVEGNQSVSGVAAALRDIEEIIGDLTETGTNEETESSENGTNNMQPTTTHPEEIPNQLMDNIIMGSEFHDVEYLDEDFVPEESEKVFDVLIDENSACITIESASEGCEVMGGAENQFQRNQRKKCLFDCYLCGSEFGFEKGLLDHYAAEHGPEAAFGFLCTLCKKSFISKHSLRIHQRIAHEQRQFCDCPECGRMISKNFYKVHLKRHQTKTQVSCDKCSANFSSNYQLKKHNQIKHEGHLREYQCNVCERSFDTLQYLRTHQLIHNDPESRVKFGCNVCHKSFLQKSSLKYHMSFHQGYSLSCGFCSKRFGRKKDLEIHERFHTKDFQYSCDICDKTFAISSHLKIHLRRHEGVQFQCYVCNRKFNSATSLKEHSFVHTSMPFSCNLCDRGLPSKAKMRRHLRGVHSTVFAETEYTDSLADQYITEMEST